ncbi:2-hydroxyacid dehydrogenase [Rhodovibrio salinarum]|uniref:2-hydroxyacid dehydrogenase n=1 Tax=Rhodovibrio salinarum TaxID=1087 RepID=A0A934V2U4_9PROT|nr:2-hydroxyacid dehydrogenase [Rhodovibrio salinarum]MBK1699116.1 2-hydroxyacid dehydrogenase [Rhodovibrio salinarum]
MSKCTVLALAPLGPPEVQEQLDSEFECHLVGRDGALDHLIAQIGDRVSALVTTGGRGAEAEVIAALPQLRLIACYGVGVDAIDFAAAGKHGVEVTNTPDVLTDDVADLAVFLLGALHRRLVQGDAWVRAGEWARSGGIPLGRSLRGRRAGILGLGRIGEATARRLTAFGAEILYYSRHPRPASEWTYCESPAALAEHSDDLIVCCRGGDATRHLVDAHVLQALGPQGSLVNIARGSVVDEAALVAALHAGGIAGAALDVFENEPDVPDSLFGLDNVVLAPHIGSATLETRRAMGELVLENLRARRDGRSLVTPVPQG